MQEIIIFLQPFILHVMVNIFFDPQNSFFPLDLIWVCSWIQITTIVDFFIFCLICFNIVFGFTKLNKVLFLGLCLSYNRHWARRGLKEGRKGYFSECNCSLFTLIPLHGLSTSSTAESQSLFAPFLFWKKTIHICLVVVSQDSQEALVFNRNT